LLILYTLHLMNYNLFFLVAIYKRAQILIADIWSSFRGTGFGEFRDIDSLTMFADYR